MNATRLAILVLILSGVSGDLVSVEAGDLYRSNAVGIRGERLDPADPEPPEYILEVTSLNNTEILDLFRESELVRRTELTRDGSTSTERVFEDDLLQRETVKRNDGTVLREDLYSGGEITESSAFVYTDGRMSQRTVTDAAGVQQFTERYSYWRNGTLRSIVKDDRSETRTEYRYRDGRLEEEWVSRAGEAERFEFDPAGRLVIRERFAGDELLEQEVRAYWSGDSGSLLKQVVVSSGEAVTRRTYDDRGRLSLETVEESGVVVSQFERSFDGDLLVEETETDNDGNRTWRYDYTADGVRQTETYLENNQLVEITYLVLTEDDAPANRMTELYNRGEAVLRVYFEDETRLREDVLRNGEVIRTRLIGTGNES